MSSVSVSRKRSHGELHAVRMLVFYIRSGTPCDYCASFIRSKSFKKLQAFGERLPGIQFLYEEYPCDWDAFDLPRYPDKKVRKMREGLRKRLDSREINRDDYLKEYMKIKGWDLEEEDVNFQFSNRYTRQFPSIALELYYIGIAFPETIMIESVIFEDENSELRYNFLDFLQRFFVNKGAMPRGMIEKFQHEKAKMGGKALLKHKLRKKEEEKKKSNGDMING